MESVSLYSEARNEYLKQLSTWIIPSIVEFFRNEYSMIVSREGHKRAMAYFQEVCAGVPKWNQDIIETNVSALLESCHCDYIEDLMTAVFIAHTKMLTAIRVNSKQKKLQITLPKLDHFLHRIFIECARSFWKAPFLFNEELPPIERQKNILQLESMATEALSGAIRSLLPVKTILRDYMNDDGSSSSEDEKPVKSEHAYKKKDESDSDSDSSSESSSDDEDDRMLDELKSDMNSAPAIAAPAVVTPVTTAVQVAPIETVTSIATSVMPIETTVIPAVPVSVPITSSNTEITDDTPLSSINKTSPVFQALQEGSEFIEKHTPIMIQKLDTPPDAPILHESQHSVHADVKPANLVLQKDPEFQTFGSGSVITPPAAPAVAPVAAPATAPQLVIETEPSVHFTPYDTVFDENKHEISEIRYAPKVSMEDKPPSNWGMFDDEEEDVPKLSISNTASSLGVDDIEDLDAPARPPAPIQPDDIDEPLTMSGGDFEEL
jgi:hypothetical protein